MPEQTLFELKNISLSYGSVAALTNVSLSLQGGAIHSVLGTHGAGKSSLCNLIGGLVRPRSGVMAWLGSPLRSFSLDTARKLGIELVTQANEMFDDMSVATNLFLNTSSWKNLKLITNGEIVRRAERYLAGYGFYLDASRQMGDLHLPERVLVDILCHIAARPRLLILDEALEKLSGEYLDKVLEILRDLKNEGTGILVATHDIDGIYRVADTVTILRNGSTLITDRVQNTEKIALLRLAYTQIERKPELGVTSADFYQLLKYNAAILELLPVTLIVTDQKNCIKLLNRAAKEYFRANGRFKLNKHIRGLFLPHNRRVYDLIRRPLSGIANQAFQRLTFRKGNIQRVINLEVMPIMDGAFKIGTMIIIDDITEQEKLKDQIHFSEKLASVGLLAAGVAHEINNPLEVISNYADHLKTRVGTSKEVRIVSNLEAEIDSIKQIISQLLTFSSEAVLETEVFDVNDLIENLLRLVKINAKARGIAFSCTKQEEPLLIKASRNELKQVFLNLIKNALEAMPNGGALKIFTSRLVRSRTPHIRILLRDSGEGIALKNVDDIFLPFFTTKNGRAEHMGLGLSVSYGIVTKYGGSIKAKNCRPRGCEFEILLPIADGVPCQPAARKTNCIKSQ